MINNGTWQALKDVLEEGIDLSIGSAFTDGIDKGLDSAATSRQRRIEWRSWIGTGKFDVVEFVAKFFFLSLSRVIDTASFTTGRLILKGWRWHIS